MSRKLPLLVILAVGGYFGFKYFKIEGWEHIKVTKRDQPLAGLPLPDGIGLPGTDTFRGALPGGAAATPANPGESIRIASFNIQVFGESKFEKTDVMHRIVDVIRRYDVVAIQEIRTKRQDLIPRLVALINADGARYDYLLGERLGRTVSKEQYAYVYNTATLEADARSAYTVDDPDDLLHRQPFVAAFRARGPPPENAFTFTLVNIHTDPDEVKQEMNFLDDVFLAVRNDGRGEDDIILLGDLNANEYQLGQLGELAGITWAIAGIPTNTRGTKSYDNIIFDARSTEEFTGRSDVFDFVRQYNISTEEALRISDHLPVWAEFSVLEGGAGRRLATRPDPTSTQ